MAALPIPFIATSTTTTTTSPGLDVEGVLWFVNLAVVDPYYILPLATGILHLLNLQVSECGERVGREKVGRDLPPLPLL